MTRAPSRLLSVHRVAPLLVLVVAGWVGVQLLQSYGSERIGREMAASAKPGDILMVSSEKCVYCTRARTWMQQHRVFFAECFIERDAACKATYEALRSPGTPVVIVRGQRQLGFSPERVAQALRAT